MSYPSSPEIPSDEDNGPTPIPWFEKKPASPTANKKGKTMAPPKKKIRKTKPFIHRPSRRSDEEINKLLNPSPEELRREDIEEEAWIAAEEEREEAAREDALRSRIRASRDAELEYWRAENARVRDERAMALRAEDWKKRVALAAPPPPPPPPPAE